MQNHIYKENIQHGSIEFPFQIYNVFLRYSSEQNRYIDDKNTSLTPLPLHYHPEFEFIYILEGEYEFLINSEEYLVTAGDIVFLNSNDLHSANSKSANCFYKAIVFKMQMLNSFINDIFQSKYLAPIVSNELTIMHTLTIDDEKRAPITNLLLELINTEDEKSFGYELDIKGKLYSLLSLLFKSNMVINKTNIENNHDANHIDRIKKALNFIQCNYTRKIYIEDLAKEMNMSKYTCCRFFREHFGTTFVEYLNNFRINMAINLFDQNIYSITEVSFMVGFSDSCYFAKVFRSFTNVSPYKYINKISV